MLRPEKMRLSAGNHEYHIGIVVGRGISMVNKDQISNDARSEATRAALHRSRT